MALFLKYQEGGETPKYSIYGDEYNFNDLERRVYEGFDDFISSIKYGKKNRDSIYSAVLDLMGGLKSGRVTYDNGRFIDSKGEYHNESKEKHDAYGIAATWIFRNMGLTEKVAQSTPETKDKYNSSVMGNYVLRDIFGSDPTTDDLQSFLDQDDWIDDTKTSKGNSNRIALLAKSINNALSNFDDIMSKYDISDEEKEKQRNYLIQAQEALKDNVLSNDEYLILRRALGSGKWNELMQTDFSTEEEQEAVPLGKKRYTLNDEEIEAPEGTSIDDIIDWYIELLEDNPEDGLSTNIYNQSTMISDLAPVQTIKNTLNKYNADLLVKTLNDFAMDKNNPKNLINVMANNMKKDKTATEIKEPRTLIIEYIYKRLAELGAVTSLGDTQFIVDNVTSPNHPNMILVVDTSQHKYRWVSKYKHPKVRDELRKQLKNQNSGISFRKKGGSLKFNGGGRVLKGENDLVIPEGYIENFYDNFGENSKYVDWDLENRILNYLENNELKHKKREQGPTNKNKNNEYDIEPGGKETEEQQWWDLWKNVLSVNEEVAEAWARGYRKLELSNTTNSTNHYGKWFNDDDSFNFKAFKNYTDPVTDEDHKLWDDGDNGIGHDFFTGKIFYILDGDNKYYYSLIPEGWNESDTVNDNGFIKEILLTLNPATKPEETSTGKAPAEGSKVIIRNLTEKGLGINWENLGKNLLPEATSIGRLAGTLANNNRAYRVLNRALHPYLQNTYERYSPVTGEYGLMSAYNLLAADYNRLAARNATSDASLNYLARLDANRRANQLREQGFLKDNDEIKRTATEALLRQEDNAKRKSEGSNANMKNISDTDYLKAALRAEQIKQNWGAWDNFLGGIEKRARTKLAEKEIAQRGLQEKAAELKAQNVYDEIMYPEKQALLAWAAKNPGKSPATYWNGYSNYVAKQKEASLAQLNSYYKSLADIYGMKYNPTSYTISNRKGGKLIKRKR